jgi:uncharacterized membrane protein
VIRRLIGLAAAGAGVGWSIDRRLAARAADAGRSAPAPVTTLIVIDAPVERVWEVLSDVAGQPRWMTDMKAVRMESSGPLGVGARGEATVRMLGVAVSDPVTITAWDPPRRFAVRHEGRFSGEGVFELEPGADGTTTIVRWSETLVPPVLPWLAAELLRPVFRAVFQADLRRLRALVETGATRG